MYSSKDVHFGWLILNSYASIVIVFPMPKAELEPFPHTAWLRSRHGLIFMCELNVSCTCSDTPNNIFHFSDIWTRCEHRNPLHHLHLSVPLFSTPRSLPTTSRAATSSEGWLDYISMCKSVYPIHRCGFSRKESSSGSSRKML
jgi:hypothetical protein